jgi:hypothetical protein
VFIRKCSVFLHATFHTQDRWQLLPIKSEKLENMNDTKQLEQTILNLTEMMDSLFSEINALKESNIKLRESIQNLNENITDKLD